MKTLISDCKVKLSLQNFDLANYSWTCNDLGNINS